MNDLIYNGISSQDIDSGPSSDNMNKWFAVAKLLYRKCQINCFLNLNNIMSPIFDNFYVW